MRTPCFNNAAFTGLTAAQQRVAPWCAGCPVVRECRVLGMGEPDGVWGGLLPDHPTRVAFREVVDPDTQCVNGHDRERYGFLVDRVHETTRLEPWGCSVCCELRDQMMEVLR